MSLVINTCQFYIESMTGYILGSICTSGATLTVHVYNKQKCTKSIFPRLMEHLGNKRTSVLPNDKDDRWDLLGQICTL